MVHKSPDLEEIAAEIGTHRQLLGLVHEWVAAAVLEKLGIRADVTRAATGAASRTTSHRRKSTE